VEKQTGTDKRPDKKVESYDDEIKKKYTAEMDEKYGKYYEYIEKEYGSNNFQDK